MTNPSQDESVEHLSRAIDELQRLSQQLPQRSKPEKKRLSQLQELVPKLKRLARSPSAEGVAVSKEELDLLASLKPTGK